MQIRNIRYPWEAKAKLEELKISWDSMLRFPVSRSPYSFKGALIYFMVGTREVAYLSPDMEVLMIHDTPHQWGKEFLESAENYA